MEVERHIWNDSQIECQVSVVAPQAIQDPYKSDSIFPDFDNPEDLFYLYFHWIGNKMFLEDGVEE